MKSLHFLFVSLLLLCTVFNVFRCSSTITRLDYYGRRLVSFNPVADRGNGSWIANRTVHGALLQTCQLVKTHLASHIKHPHICENVSASATSALSHVSSNIAIPFFAWPMVLGKACPSSLFPSLHPPSHTSSSSLHHRLPISHERGYGLSHVQIWLEFVFFDIDLLEARKRSPPEYLTSNSYSSVSGIFQTFANGTLLKNGIPFLEDDVIFVLEEDSVPFLNANFSQENFEILKDELQRLHNGVLIFKECSHSGFGVHGRPTRDENRSSPSLFNSRHLRRLNTDSHSYISEGRSDQNHHHLIHQSTLPAHQNSCFNNYAINRKIARSLSSFYDVCGKNFEHQMIQALRILNITIHLSDSNLFIFPNT
jgi:hypothetical protein